VEHGLPLRRVQRGDIEHPVTLRTRARLFKSFCYASNVEDRYQELVAEMRSEFPGLRIVKKPESALQRAIHKALVVVTLGAQRRYLDGYQTTIGRTIYVTSDWDLRPAAERYVTLRHERVHLRQFARYGLVLMSVLYLLIPFPVGLAWFRARLEWEAYAESIRAQAELHGRAAAAEPRFRERIVSQFTSGAYGWMWPFRRAVETWYDGALESLP
jgi:hypothetical protein